MQVKLLTRPNDKVIFFIALFGVALATAAILLLPSGQQDSVVSGATSRPFEASATRPTTRPAFIAGTTAEFPTQDYADLLEQYVHDGGVDYQGLSTDGRDVLNKIANAIARTSPDALNRMSKAEREAWFINAYNLLTLKLIVDHYPVESIRDIDDPWGTRMTVAGQQMTLDEIEHDVLRMKDAPEAERRAQVDPRLHFALNCASIGCPDLLDEPFTAENLEELYNQGVQRFVSNPNKFRIENNTLYISQLLDWYGDDFRLLYEPGTSRHDAIGRFFAHYVNDAQQASLLRSGDFEIEWLEYDWALNELKSH